jgi:hypothetical protein
MLSTCEAHLEWRVGNSSQHMKKERKCHLFLASVSKCLLLLNTSRRMIYVWDMVLLAVMSFIEGEGARVRGEREYRMKGIVSMPLSVGYHYNHIHTHEREKGSGGIFMSLFLHLFVIAITRQ